MTKLEIKIKFAKDAVDRAYAYKQEVAPVYNIDVDPVYCEMILHLSTIDNINALVQHAEAALAN